MLTFTTEGNDGTLTWMEDEEYLKITGNVLMDNTDTGWQGKTYYRDTALYVHSSADTALDLVADGWVNVAAPYLKLSNGSTNGGEIRFYEDTDNGSLYTGFKVGNQTGSVVYTFPLDDGSNGQQLTTDGGGTLTWASAGSGGGGGTPTDITVADTTDSTCYVALFESATGDLAPKTDAGLQYDASNGRLTVGGNIETGAYLEDDAGTLNLAAASTSYSIYFRGGTTTRFRMNLSSKYFAATTSNDAELGTSSLLWKKIWTNDLDVDGTCEADAYSIGSAAGASSGGQAVFLGNPPDLYAVAFDGGLLTSFSNLSDSSVKENISTFTESGLDFINNKVTLKSFNYKKDYLDSKNIDTYGTPKNDIIGIIAQDCEAIDDSYVETVDGLKKPSQKYTMEYNAALINAIKELSAKNDALEARIAALEG